MNSRGIIYNYNFYIPIAILSALKNLLIEKEKERLFALLRVTD